MKIITNNAEEGLLQTLEQRKISPDMGCCLQIKGRLFEEDDFLHLPKWITGWVGDSHSEIYVCHDRDIFVFSPYMTHKSYLQFKGIFQDRFAPQKAAYSISFYDLHESAAALTEAIESKLIRRLEEESRQAMDLALIEQENKSSEFHKMHLNHLHTSTLKKRRATRGHLKILIVEDDPFSRKLISAILEKEYDISFSENGYTAVIDYLNLAPNIMFLDINLPDVTGLDVLLKIKSFDPEAYPVMLSGNSNGDNVRTAIELGAKGFVGKPFSREKLIHYIQKCKSNSSQKVLV